MSSVMIRFYEELNDFLPAQERKKDLTYSFEGNPSVREVIEAMGVLPAEVDLILINGISSDFSHKLHNNDRVSVYPVFESLDISGARHLRGEPLREIKFIADAHLGRLAKYLRLLGFDTTYDNRLDDRTITDLSISEKRIILTRDRLLLMNRRVTHGYWVRSVYPRIQAREIVKKFQLENLLHPFTRCLECNKVIEKVSREEVENRLPPRTKEYYDRFWICPNCHRIYWEGSHYARMKKFTEMIVKDDFS